MPSNVTAEQVVHKMAVDKKNQGGVKYMVYLRSIGDAGAGAEPVADETLLRILSPAVEVVPPGPILGEIRVPGSKSISNRALLMAALGRGPCRLKGLLHSDDTKVRRYLLVGGAHPVVACAPSLTRRPHGPTGQVMIGALRKLGVTIEFEENGHTVLVEGVDGALQPANDDEVRCRPIFPSLFPSPFPFPLPFPFPFPFPSFRVFWPPRGNLPNGLLRGVARVCARAALSLSRPSFQHLKLSI
jgi:pentafunctional AROM polypeptide